MDDEYDGFEWVQLMKYEENVITFLRKTEKPEETLLVICNFAAIPYENYQVGVPFAGVFAFTVLTSFPAVLSFAVLSFAVFAAVTFFLAGAFPGVQL